MHPRNMPRRGAVHVDDDEFILPQTPQGVLSLLEEWWWITESYDEQELWSIITVSSDYIRVITLAYDVILPEYHTVRVNLIKKNGAHETKSAHYFRSPEYSIKSRPTKIRLI